MIQEPKKLLYISNLRLTVIILVVLMHLAVTYSGIGRWFYMDAAEPSIGELIFFGYFQSMLQGFFLGILFLIAGYFVPTSYDKKGFGKFMRDRLIRLGIPTLMFMFIINPFIHVAFSDSRYLSLDSFWIGYLRYVVSLDFLGASGPMWFTFALLIFTFVYAVIRKLSKKEPDISDKPFPAVKKLIALIVVITVCTFLVRLAYPVGADLLNFQLGHFSSYIALFIVGIKCRRHGWIEKLNYKTGKPWLVAVFTVGAASWIVMMLAGGALEGDFDTFMGGPSWQAAAFAAWESFIGVAMSIGLIALYKEKVNRQSRLSRAMSDNAFSVYVFHPPIIIGLTMLFAPVELAPILKFLIMAIVCLPACFLFTNFVIRKIPALRKLLV